MQSKQHIFLKAIIFVTSVIFVITFLLSFFYSSTINQSKNRMDLSTGSHIHFAAVLIGNEAQFLEKLQKGIQKSADESHVEVEFFIVKTVEEGTEMMKLLITAGVDGIITQGIHEMAFIEVLKEAKQTDIPLVLEIADYINKGIIYGTLYRNPEKMGYMALYSKSKTKTAHA